MVPLTLVTGERMSSGAIDAQGRRGIYPAGRIGQKHVGGDLDVAALCLSTALATIWLSCKMTNSGSMVMLPPVVCGPPPTVAVTWLSTQPHQGLRLHRNIAPIGLGRFGRHGALFTQESIPGLDGNAAGIPRPSAFCGDRCRLTEFDGTGPQANIASRATPLCSREQATCWASHRNRVGDGEGDRAARAGARGRLEICAPSVRESAAAVTWMSHPAWASIPWAWARVAWGNRQSGSVSARVRALVTVRVMGPPGPGPKVVLLIWAPSVREIAVAVTWMTPASAPAWASIPWACGKDSTGEAHGVHARPG